MNRSILQHKSRQCVQLLSLKGIRHYALLLDGLTASKLNRFKRWMLLSFIRPFKRSSSCSGRYMRHSWLIFCGFLTGIHLLLYIPNISFNKEQSHFRCLLIVNSIAEYCFARCVKSPLICAYPKCACLFIRVHQCGRSIVK